MGESLHDLKRQLVGTFFEESAEGLEQLEAGLLRLEGDFDPTVVDDIFRAAHSIKGGAGTFGFTVVTDLAHEMETLLDQVRTGALRPTPETMALLLEGVDTLRGLFSALRDGREVDAEAHAPLRRRLQAASIQAMSPSPAPFVAPTTAAGPPSLGWRIHFRPMPHLLESGNEPWRLIRELEAMGDLTIEVDLSGLPPLGDIVPTTSYLSWRLRLVGAATRAAVDEVFAWVVDDCELQIEALSEGLALGGSGSPDGAQAAAGPSSPSAAPVPLSDTGLRRRADDVEGGMASLRVGIDKVDALMNLVGELVITQSMLGGLDEGGPLDDARRARLREGLSQLARNSRALQESVMRLRSVPLSLVFNRFPRLVHDLSSQLGKRVELVMSGQNTELDKTVIEKLGDPMVHLVRNSLDHGFETPEERSAAGKRPVGRLSMSAFHRGADIIIEVEDDGRGLDLDRILRKARERGIVSAEANLRPDEIRDLIFAPGFSTTEVVTDLSGRGVGMDVVRRNVKGLGGDIAIESTRGLGTKTTLRLPLTLAIIDGQLIRTGEHTYVIPLLSIVESVQIDVARLKTVAGGWHVYRVREQLVPVLDLGTLLGFPSENTTLAGRLLVMVEADGRRIGLIVDELQGQQQVVIKSLEANYGRVDGIAGATILGDGSVAFILEMAGLGRLSRSTASGRSGGAAVTLPSQVRSRPAASS